MKNFGITVDPEICHGKPVFAGTRIMVWQVLSYLAVGKSFDDIRAEFPSLTNQNITDALLYSSQILSNENFSTSIVS